MGFIARVWAICRAHAAAVRSDPLHVPDNVFQLTNTAFLLL